MAFSSIMTFICVGYVLAYGSMVFYDLFLAKEPIVLTPKIEEEEIDISDEVKTFTPVVVDKDGRFTYAQDKSQDEEKGGELSEEKDEEQVDDNSEDKAKSKELESEANADKVIVESQQNAERETDSADEIEDSAREQAEAWMNAQTGGTVEAEDEVIIEIETENESDDVEQNTISSESRSQVQPETDSQTELQFASLNEEPPVMTGAIEIGELMDMMDVLAERGEDSPLGQLVHTWYLEDAA